MTYNYTPIRMAKIRWIFLIRTSADKDSEQVELLHIADRNVKWYIH